MRFEYSATEERATDAELIAAVVGGNKAAFAGIVRRYEEVVARTVIGMLGAGDAAEEAGQVAMIKIYNGLGDFRADASLKTYVTRIAMNTALDELRRRKRFLARFVSPSRERESDVFEQIPAHGDVASAHERQQLVAAALAALKPEFRSVAVLRLLHGYDSGEVASILGISDGTVFSRLSRARSQLKMLLRSEDFK
ncbi:MAG: RNA polymerase sigma factor [Pseudomonadota bacterium]